MAFDALRQADDHSEAVVTRFLLSETPNTISVSPRQPVLSSSGITWCKDAKTWLRSIASPLRIRSHWDEGIPAGEFGAILIKNLVFEISWL